MKIGLMADTHDRLDAVVAAIDLFNKEKVTDVLHAGDLVSPFVAPMFSKLKARMHYVWGNNEGDREYITVKFKEIGIVPYGDFAELKLHGLRIALLHGRYESVVNALIYSDMYDVIVRGHSHKAEIAKSPTLSINPGEVCGYLSGYKTVALLSVDTMNCEIREL
jgi:putative phosphoesterase